MTKTALFFSAATAALAAALPPAQAATPVPVQSAIATAQSPLVFHEFSFYNAAQSAAALSGVSINSGTVQSSFVTNQSSQLTPGSNYTVAFGVSESLLTSDLLAQWQNATNTQGQSLGGNLLQLPFLGTAVPIPVVNAAITTNGALMLSDNDLCGIFSGKITNWNQITVPVGGTAPAAGQITVVYRTDAGGTTYNLTNHLAKVCNSGNSNFLPGFAPTQTFAALFAGGKVPGAPATFVGVKGNSGVVNYLSSLSGVTVTSAISYTSPDYTSIAPAPDGKLSNGNPSALVVAALLNNGKYYTPTAANITTALVNPGPGATNVVPPTTQAAAANPLSWGPSIPTPSKGYPIVAYSVFLTPQCFANPAVTAAVKGFLTAHYKTASYLAQQSNNGLVHVGNAGGGRIYSAMSKNLIGNANKWNVELGDKAACKSVTGR